MAVLTTAAATTAAAAAGTAATTAAAGTAAAAAGMGAGAAAAGAGLGAAGTAAAAGAAGAAGGGIGLAGAGAIASGAGAIGQGVMARKSALEQKKMANIQNAREKKKALSSLRMARARLEAMGVESGTSGGSSMLGARASEAANTASAIGFQGQMLSGMNKVSGFNSAASAFGLLEQGGGFVQKNPELTGSMGKSLFS